MESNPPSEKYNILIKDKRGCFALNPFSSKQDKLFSLPECTQIISAKKHFAVVISGKLSLYLSADFSLAKQFDDLELVAAVDFSPKEKYVVIIQKPSVQNNLKVINLENYEVSFLFHSTTHPSTQWPQITFNSKEDLIYRHIKTTIDIFKINPQTKEQSNYGSLENIISYEKAEYSNDKGEVENALLVGKVVTIPNKGKKCYFSMYNLNDLTKPFKEMNVSLTDRMKMKLSPDNKAIIVQAINDNTSSQSYYGNSTLYYTDIETLKFQKFALPEGPIHDFDWCPDGNNFIICAGHLPSKTNLYNKEGKLVKEICTGKFNRVKISPDSRMVALCGFGSLNGDIEFYNLENYQRIVKYNFFCCVNFNWSIDSKYLLGAVLSTRVKVDNEYRILKYNGEEVLCDKNVGEIYECVWVHDDNKQYEKFDIEVNKKSLEKKEKAGIKLTSTLGAITFSNSKSSSESNTGGIVGLGKKKKKKKNQ